jgi:hypothetical protein
VKLTMTTQAPSKGFSKLIPKPWGHEVLYTGPELPYTGKLLCVRAGMRLSMQVHDAKTETMSLLVGQAVLELESNLGVMERFEMEPTVGYTIFSGRRHRLSAITDVTVAEVSTPERGTTLRLEDDFGRVNEQL